MAATALERGSSTSGIEEKAILNITKELSAPLRWCSAVLSALLLGLGNVAVFWTDNELGSAALLVVGALFTVIAAVGHVPKFKWAGAEMDPSAVYLAGSVAGAERAGEEIAERLADSPERQEMLDDAVREVVSQLWSTSLANAGIAGPNPDEPTGPAMSTGSQFGVQDPLSAESHPTADGLTESAIAILGRFANFNELVDHRRVARALSALGYTAVTPQGRGRRHSTAAYLRWIYAGRVRKATLYQNSAGLISDSQQQLEFALRLEGAQREGGVHPKVRFYYDSSSEATVINAARSLCEFADGTASAE